VDFRPLGRHGKRKAESLLEAGERDAR